VTERRALARAIDALGPGDTLIVTRLDRLARSTRDLLNVLDAVGKAGAGFRSIADVWADTTTPHGWLMLTVLGGLAEFERELIRARTDEGRKRAQARGVRFGRKLKLTAHQAPRGPGTQGGWRGPGRHWAQLQRQPLNDFTAIALFGITLLAYPILALPASKPLLGFGFCLEALYHSVSTIRVLDPNVPFAQDLPRNGIKDELSAGWRHDCNYASPIPTASQLRRKKKGAGGTRYMPAPKKLGLPKRPKCGLGFWPGCVRNTTFAGYLGKSL